MTRHTKRWLNDARLLQLGGRYEGEIARVIEDEVHNRFTAQREVVPVICFVDYMKLIPNFTMRAELIEMFGPETDAWIGRRIVVERQRKEHVNRATGEARERWVKVVTAAEAPPRPRAIDRTEQNESPKNAPALITADDIWGNRRAR